MFSLGSITVLAGIFIISIAKAHLDYGYGYRSHNFGFRPYHINREVKCVRTWIPTVRCFYRRPIPRVWPTDSGILRSGPVLYRPPYFPSQIPRPPLFPKRWGLQGPMPFLRYKPTPYPGYISLPYLKRRMPLVPRLNPYFKPMMPSLNRGRMIFGIRPHPYYQYMSRPLLYKRMLWGLKPHNYYGGYMTRPSYYRRMFWGLRPYHYYRYFTRPYIHRRLVMGYRPYQYYRYVIRPYYYRRHVYGYKPYSYYRYLSHPFYWRTLKYGYRRPYRYYGYMMRPFQRRFHHSTMRLYGVHRLSGTPFYHQYLVCYLLQVRLPHAYGYRGGNVAFRRGLGGAKILSPMMMGYGYAGRYGMLRGFNNAEGFGTRCPIATRFVGGALGAYGCGSALGDAAGSVVNIGAGRGIAGEYNGGKWTRSTSTYY